MYRNPMHAMQIRFAAENVLINPLAENIRRVLISVNVRFGSEYLTTTLNIVRSTTRVLR
jgi:hypothetical protein